MCTIYIIITKSIDCKLKPKLIFAYSVQSSFTENISGTKTMIEQKTTTKQNLFYIIIHYDVKM